MTVRVSVVVPTYKRPDFLERCLRALLVLEFAPAEYEIVIVDAANSEQTRAQVEIWAQSVQMQGPSVRYLALAGPIHGLAAARNAGWRAAHGEIVAFTDEDCIPELHWLRAGSAAFVGAVAAVAGKVVVPLLHTYTDYEYNTAQLSQGEFVTANCFYRRDVLLQVGGFDERFAASWREDSDLFFTLLERALVCISVPEAVILHPVRPAHWGISLFQQRKGMYNALLFKKHPTLYRQRIQASPPWHDYCILGVLLLLGIGASLALWWLVVLAFLVWLYMTARFCIRRLQKTSRAPKHVWEMMVTSALIPPLAISWRLYGMCKFNVFFL